MKIVFALMLTALSINMSSCTKEGNGDVGTSALVNTTHIPIDYKIKFQGNYNCKGQKTFYNHDTPSTSIITNSEFILTVMSTNGVDSGMTFVAPELMVSSKVNEDGTFGEKGYSVYGKMVLPDSVYFYLYNPGHAGDTEWKIEGKK